MNTQAIEARLAKLRAEKEENEAQIKHRVLLREAYHGAIQDCEYWLKEMAAAEETAQRASGNVVEFRDVNAALDTGTPVGVVEQEKREATREERVG